MTTHCYSIDKLNPKVNTPPPPPKKTPQQPITKPQTCFNFIKLLPVKAGAAGANVGFKGEMVEK